MNDIFAGKLLAPPRVLHEKCPDGSFVLRSPEPLLPYARCVGQWLEHWAVARPQQTFLAEQRDGQWFEMSYSQTRFQVGALAQGLLELDLPPGKPLVVLSENDIDHALLTLAAMHIGMPVTSVSVAYSQGQGDCARLRAVLELLDPGLIFVNDGHRYARALSIAQPGCLVVAARQHEHIPGALPLVELAAQPETPAVIAAFEQLGPEDAARYILTSGSTGTPKVVITSHKMLCANQQAIAQCWKFIEQCEIVVLDWLPWSHVFGCNHNFNLVLRNGGSLYIDDGRPLPGAIERTLENIRTVRPTLYFNVPKGYEVMLSFLEADEHLAKCFFERLEMLFYAGAALPASLWSRLKEVAARSCSKPLFFTTEWGATETSPVLTSVHYPIDRPGNIGLPVPGIEIKFVPNGEKLEMRVRGESVFTRYLNNPELTAQSFDEQGFYRIGDAGALVDPAAPHRGIHFEGRVSEDFKLSTGSWVSVGNLRLRVVAALAPFVQDCVIAGHDRDELGVLLFVTPALRALAGPGGEHLTAEELAATSAVRQALQRGIDEVARTFPASSQHCARAIILDIPPSLEAGEITDKGYINQRQVLALRADKVARLFAEQPDAAIIVCALVSGELSHASRI